MDQKATLLEQLSSFDPIEVNSLFEQLCTKTDQNMSSGFTLEPFDEHMVKKKSELPEAELKLYEERGNQLIRDAKVCTIVLAGGQGSRLGYEHPKGTFCVPGLADRSIFQFLTERFIRAQLNAHGVNLRECGGQIL